MLLKLIALVYYVNKLFKNSLKKCWCKW